MLCRCLRFFHVFRTFVCKNLDRVRPIHRFLPIIGSLDRIRGVYLATGHEGIGITEGPITGKLISQLVTGQQPEIDLSQLTLDRFAN